MAALSRIVCLEAAADRPLSLSAAAAALLGPCTLVCRQRCVRQVASHCVQRVRVPCAWLRVLWCLRRPCLGEAAGTGQRDS